MSQTSQLEVIVVADEYEIHITRNQYTNRVIIDVMRRDRQDSHDHWHGPERTVVVDDLFQNSPSSTPPLNPGSR